MNKKQNTRMLYNTFTYLVAFASSLAISFILTPYLVNTFGKETYSFYTIATNLSSYMMTVCNALNIMACRYVALEINKNNFSRANDYFKSVFLSNTIICIVISVPMALIVIFLEYFMNVPDNAMILLDIKWLFSFVFLSLIVNVMASLYSICTIARDRMDLRAYKEITAGILKLLLIFGMFSLYVPRIRFIGIALFAVAVFNAIVQFFYTRSITPELKLKDGKFRWEYVKDILISSVWNTLNSLGGNLLSGISIVLINILISAAEASYVSIVHTLIGLLNGLITVVVTSFYPKMLKAYTVTKEEFFNTTHGLQKILSAFTCIAIVGIILMCDDFYRLWMPAVQTDRLVLITNIQIVAVFFTGNVYMYTNANTLALKFKVPAIVLSSLAAFNIVGSVILKMLFDISMVELLIFNVTLNSLYYVAFIPLYVKIYMSAKVMIVYKRILISILSTAVTVFVGNALDKAIFITNWVMFFVKALLIGGVALVIISLLGLVPYTKLFNKFLKKRD